MVSEWRQRIHPSPFSFHKLWTPDASIRVFLCAFVTLGIFVSVLFCSCLNRVHIRSVESRHSLAERYTFPSSCETGRSYVGYFADSSPPSLPFFLVFFRSDSDWSGLGELWTTATTTEAGGSPEIGRGKSRGRLGVLGSKEVQGDSGEDSGASGNKGRRPPFDSSFSSPSSAFDRRKSRVGFLNHPDGTDSHTVGDQGGQSHQGGAAMKNGKGVCRFSGKGEAAVGEGGGSENENEWRSQIEERLEQLEKSLTGITRAVQQVANGTKEMNDKMQDWFSTIGGKLSRLQVRMKVEHRLP